MKSIAQIALSMLISLQSIGINPVDLLQVGEFYEHYQFHQEEYGHDLITFIELHYGEHRAEHQQEHQGHEDLPFHQNHSSHIVFYVTTDAFQMYPLPALPKGLSTYFPDNYSSIFADEILQPPRV